jgi:hypothetical protein
LHHKHIKKVPPKSHFSGLIDTPTPSLAFTLHFLSSPETLWNHLISSTPHDHLREFPTCTRIYIFELAKNMH